MKKLLSLICSLSLSAALLAGCSSTPQEPTASQTPSDSETPTTSQSVTTEAVDVKVMALKGPTAMGMVQFMSETDNGSITDNNYDFRAEENYRKRGPQNFGQNCRTDWCGHYPFFLKSHSFQ